MRCSLVALRLRPSPHVLGWKPAGWFNPILMTSRCLSTSLHSMSYPKGVHISINWQACVSVRVCVRAWVSRAQDSAKKKQKKDGNLFQLVESVLLALQRLLGNCYHPLQLTSVFTLSQQTKLSPCTSSVGCGKILIMVFACGLRARECTDGPQKAVGLIGTCTYKRENQESFDLLCGVQRGIEKRPAQCVWLGSNPDSTVCCLDPTLKWTTSRRLPHVVNWNGAGKEKADGTLPAAPSRRPHQQPGRVDVQLAAQPVDQSGVSQQRPLEAQDGRLAGQGMEEVHPSMVSPLRLISPVCDSNDLLSPARLLSLRGQTATKATNSTVSHFFSREQLFFF